MRRHALSWAELTLASASPPTVGFASAVGLKIPIRHEFGLQKYYAQLLRICAENSAISGGKSIHSRILRTIPKPDLFLSNSLVNMYCNCGSIRYAHILFDEISQPDVVSWNTMIAGCFSSGLSSHAFGCFRNMLSCSMMPDQFTFSSFFKGCICLGCFEQGLQAHCIVMKSGLGENVFVGSTLLDFYGSFYCFEEAKKVFDCFLVKDTVLVNNMIGICAKNGNVGEALAGFQFIFSSSFGATRATFVNILNAFQGYGLLGQGQQVHCLIIKSGFENEGAVENSLVGMYCSCDSMHNAFSLLVSLGSVNVMSWTTLIMGYSSHGCINGAMDVFKWAYHESLEIDDILLACILCISAAAECLLFGMQIHSIALKRGFEMTSSIRDALMDMYAKCSCLEYVMRIFQLSGANDLVSWTTLISGLVHNGLSEDALINFRQMQKDEVNPDSVACVTALTACIDLGAINRGEQIHAYIFKFGYEANVSIQTTLLSLYSEGCRLDAVLKVFKRMVDHDVISCTALISSYVKVGNNEKAMASFLEMLQQGIWPNNFTLSSALTACGKLTALETGKSLHAHVNKVGLEHDRFIGCAVIDMYYKCGSMKDAVCYFEGTTKSDVVLWNALLSGYAHHGNGLGALEAFDEMQKLGVRPDHITFLAIFSSCSHSGLSDMAVHYFVSMCKEYGISPMKEHYASVVDALGRAGLFKESVRFINAMAIAPGATVLRTLLSSCVAHGCIQLGLAVGAKMVILGNKDAATYVLLSNLFAIDGRWDDSKKVREVIERKCFTGKETGKSWIESRISLLG